MLAQFKTRDAVLAEMKRRRKAQGEMSTTGGFASDKVGKDGLTGPERAKKYGGKKPYKSIE